MCRTPIANVAVAAAALAAVATTAATALAGPDFVTGDRAAPLAASDVRRIMEPADDILFALDAVDLDPIAALQLAGVARWLDGRPDDRIVVEGRADSSGSAEHNIELATQRAEIVRNHLIGAGVDPDRIVIAVYGETGARQRPEAHDRRAVVYASAAPLPQLIAAELDRDAMEVVWTHLGSRLRETRGITPVAASGAR